jgi:hypothetical protein
MLVSPSRHNREDAMIPAGYIYKQAAAPPEWLKQVPGVDRIFSVSGCIAAEFGDTTNHWRHNGFWLFDQPSIMLEIAQADGIDLRPMTLFYYEAYELELNDDSGWSPGAAGSWTDIAANDFPTNVTPPPSKTLRGFDVVTHMKTVADPGCSPLSCNLMAQELPVNRHCLFDTFAQAKAAVDAGHFTGSEPGSLRIFAVHTVEP